MSALLSETSCGQHGVNVNVNVNACKCVCELCSRKFLRKILNEDSQNVVYNQNYKVK